MKSLLILGAGGFGHMIQEMAGILGYEKAVFLDDAVKGADVVGKCCDYRAFVKNYDTAVAALGDNGCACTGQKNSWKRVITFRL